MHHRRGCSDQAPFCFRLALPLTLMKPLTLALLTFLSLLGLAAPVAGQGRLFAPDAVTDTVWSNIQPGPNDWITALPATLSITAQNGEGLSDDAAYRYSTDGGATWTGWRTQNLAVGNPISTTRHLTVTGLALGQNLNFVQYRIRDALDTLAESPALLLRVDTQGPPAPISPQPQPAGWTNQDHFGAAWSNPTDLNGIGGAWYKLGAAPAGAGDGVFVAGDGLASLDGIQVGGDGQHTLWLWLADRLGNADPTTAQPLTLRLDTTPPPALIAAQVAPAGWTNVNRFDLTWTAPADASGLAAVRYRLDAAPLHPGDGQDWPGALNGFSGYSIPGGADGDRRLWLWPVDGAGNAALPAAAVALSLKLDTTPPGPPLVAPVVTPAGWQGDPNAAFRAVWQNPVDLSGIAEACYKLGSEPLHNRDGVCVSGAGIDRIEGIRPQVPGSFHLFLWLVDAAGNVDKNRRQVALDAIRWDPIPPEVFVDVTGALGNNGWYVEPVDISIIASDVGSSVDGVEYNLDFGGWVSGRQVRISAEGFHHLAVRASDVAGNRTEVGPEAYNIDLTPPRTEIALNRTPLYQDWYDGTVTAFFTLVDAASGADQVQWQLDGGSWQQGYSAIIDADGEHSLTFRGIDRAGNVEAPQSRAIHIDRFPPVTSYAILPGEAPTGWYTSPVTVTLVPADEGAGVAATYYRIDSGAWVAGTQFMVSASGEYEVEFYSVDFLGHAETPYRIPGGIRIDREAPRAPTPLGIQPQVWSQTNSFDLTLAMPPDLSGIAGLYYKVGQPPAAPDDGVWRPGSANVLRDVRAPAEGRFPVFVWLKDGAGNVDHTRSAVWEEALALTYDATPPLTTAQLQGTAGEHGWFTSPVTITMVATDTHAGVVETWTRVNGSEPITNTTVFTLTTSDKHILLFASVDAAGNAELPQLLTMRIDTTAPAAPQAVQTSPTGWSQVNRFALTWSNPPDNSGIAGGYYKVGDPPTHPHDGQRVPPIGIVDDIAAPAEGAWDLHFWLVDQAGNAGFADRVSLSSALLFDGTPPQTTATVRQGHLTASGWYTSPVTIDLQAVDGVSGVTLLRYRLDDGEWVEGDGAATLTLAATGRYDLAFQAMDGAGNVEALQQQQIWVDLAAPRPFFQPISRYQRLTSFEMAWDAVDQPQGSELDGFDLQVRDGRNGPWLNWGNPNVIDTGARYFGSFGHRYFFRLRARDRAGNLSPWVELPWGVYVDRLADGDFAGGAFGAWQPSGALARQVMRAPGPQGQETLVAQLGSPDYGPNVPGHDIPLTGPGSEGSIPVGNANIAQRIRIPGGDVLDHPTLTFWYRIFTYDTTYSEAWQRWFDTLDLRLIGPGGDMLALRDGLPRSEWQENKLADLGWRFAHVTLPPSWADELVTFRIENWNRQDGRLNTWSQVTDVRLWEPYHVYLPRIGGGGLEAQSLPPTSDPPAALGEGLR